MNEIVRAALAATALIVLYSIIHSFAPAYAPLISLAGAVVILYTLIRADNGRILQNLTALRETDGSEAFICLFKSAGILLITDYTSELCKDAGQASAAVCMEFAGRCMVLMTAWPVFTGVFQAIEELTL